MRSVWQIAARHITTLKIGLFTAGLIATTLVPMLANPATTRAVTDCSPNGILLASTSWLGGAGVNVCNHPGDGSANYVNNINNVSTRSGYKWECVELVNRLYLTKGWTTTTWSGNGNTLVNNVPSGLTKQDNGAISYINTGDVITLDDGGPGHAAIINTTGSTYGIINQNADLNSSAYIQSGSLSAGNAFFHMNAWAGYSVQAIIHHPAGGSSVHTTTLGSFDPSTATFYLRNSNTPGSADIITQYGAGGWKPVVGDWDANRTVTLGSFDPSTATFYLRNSNIPGSADIVAQFGFGGAIPIAGDWDANGTTTIGVYDPSTSTFYLRNSNTPGSADAVIQFGGAGWLPVVGDWDGNGSTTIGVFDPSTATFYLRNSNTPGSADAVIQYGAGGWTPIVGDWDGNGTTTIGSFNPSTATFYLRNSNTPGSADIVTQYGAGGWTPIVGDWDGQ